jgi:hypothetical protein
MTEMAGIPTGDASQEAETMCWASVESRLEKGKKKEKVEGNNSASQRPHGPS